jgi:hypothetical protein
MLIHLACPQFHMKKQERKIWLGGAGPFIANWQHNP